MISGANTIVARASAGCADRKFLAWAATGIVVGVAEGGIALGNSIEGGDGSWVLAADGSVVVRPEPEPAISVSTLATDNGSGADEAAITGNCI